VTGRPGPPEFWALEERIATSAGGHLLTDEIALTQIRARLQLQPGAALPHFEALLSTRKIRGTATSYEMVLVRRVGS
jgi:hypothetical protein